MAQKRYKAEQIVTLLRQMDVAVVANYNPSPRTRAAGFLQKETVRYQVGRAQRPRLPDTLPENLIRRKGNTNRPIGNRPASQLE